MLPATTPTSPFDARSKSVQSIRRGRRRSATAAAAASTTGARKHTRRRSSVVRPSVVRLVKMIRKDRSIWFLTDDGVRKERGGGGRAYEYARARARTDSSAKPRRTINVCTVGNRPSDRRGPGLFSHEGRNLRSTCRCSHNLRITRRRAVSCGLHRSTSQVIHRSGLCVCSKKKKNYKRDRSRERARRYERRFTASRENTLFLPLSHSHSARKNQTARGGLRRRVLLCARARGDCWLVCRRRRRETKSRVTRRPSQAGARARALVRKGGRRRR